MDMFIHCTGLSPKKMSEMIPLKSSKGRYGSFEFFLSFISSFEIIFCWYNVQCMDIITV